MVTYLEDGVEYVEQLRMVFKKAGVDVTKQVVDEDGVTHPRVAFTTYRNHLSINAFRYASTGILAGVQQRHKADIAGAMCGARKSIASPVDFLEVDLVHQAVASADAQQAIGRLRRRRIKDGKALPVRVFISHLDDRARNFKTRLMRAFPQATWKDRSSEERLKKSQTYQVMLAVKDYLGSNYQGKPVPTSQIKKDLGLYKDYSLRSLSERVWKDAMS